VKDSQGGPSRSTENTLMKTVTPYDTGRQSNPRATGLDALRMKWRTSRNSRTDIAPDISGDKNQDTTATCNVFRLIACHPTAQFLSPQHQCIGRRL
jgi:hypothetical protein